MLRFIFIYEYIICTAYINIFLLTHTSKKPLEAGTSNRGIAEAAWHEPCDENWFRTEIWDCAAELLKPFSIIITLIHRPAWHICWYIFVSQLILTGTMPIFYPVKTQADQMKFTEQMKRHFCFFASGVPPVAGQAVRSNPGNNLHWRSQGRQPAALVSTHRSNIMKHLEFRILFVWTEHAYCRWMTKLIGSSNSPLRLGA